MTLRDATLRSAVLLAVLSAGHMVQTIRNGQATEGEVSVCGYHGNGLMVGATGQYRTGRGDRMCIYSTALHGCTVEW